MVLIELYFCIYDTSELKYLAQAHAGCERVNGTECGEERTASQSVLRNLGKPLPMSYGTLATACSPFPTVEVMYQRKVIMFVICCFMVAVLLLASLGLNGGMLISAGSPGHGCGHNRYIKIMHCFWFSVFRR